MPPFSPPADPLESSSYHHRYVEAPCFALTNPKDNAGGNGNTNDNDNGYGYGYGNPLACGSVLAAPFLHHLFELQFDPCDSLDSLRSLCTSFPSRSTTAAHSRPCAECGRNCDRSEGYSYTLEDANESKSKSTSKSTSKSKPTQTATEAMTKIYRHDLCVQRKGWKSEHAKTYRPVLKELLLARKRSTSKKGTSIGSPFRSRKHRTSIHANRNAKANAKANSKKQADKAHPTKTAQRPRHSKKGEEEKETDKDKALGKTTKRGFFNRFRRKKQHSEPPKVININTKKQRRQQARAAKKSRVGVEPQTDEKKKMKKTTTTTTKKKAKWSMSRSKKDSAKKSDRVEQSKSKSKTKSKSPKTKPTQTPTPTPTPTTGREENDFASKHIKRVQSGAHRGRTRHYKSASPEEDLFII